MSTLLEQASLVMIPSGYKEDIVYSQIPTNGNGDLTFTRASDGTRVNSAGLVEVCPWNLVSYSEQFDSPFWNKGTSGSATFVVTANATTAPNGTNTADLISITRSATSELAATYTFVGQGVGTFKNTIWLKAKDSSNVGKTIDLWSWEGDTRGYTKVTLTADWVRYEQNTTVFTGTASELFDFGLLPISYSTSTTLAVEFYAWGAQSNIGSTAKPYFPTTDRLNVPRLTYQNGGGGCPSLLLEKQSTNLLVYSEQFDQWATNGTTTANVAISPDGTQNADRLNFTSGNIYWLDTGVNATNGQQYTYSLYVKPIAIGDQFRFYIDGAFNVSTVITTNSSDWKRYEWTFTASATGSINPHILLGYGYNSQSMLVWGAQLEASSYATSYIPTTSASATRVADACYKTGISSLIGQTEGVMFAEINVPSIATAGNYSSWQLNDGSTSNLIDFTYYSTGRIQAIAFIGGSLQVNIDLTSFGLTAGNHKIAFAYKLNDYVLYVDGVQVGSDTSAQVPAMSKCDLFTGSNQITIYNQFAVFPTRLTNAELASLTTI